MGQLASLSLTDGKHDTPKYWKFMILLNIGNFLCHGMACVGPFYIACSFNGYQHGFVNFIGDVWLGCKNNNNSKF